MQGGEKAEGDPCHDGHRYGGRDHQGAERRDHAGRHLRRHGRLEPSHDVYGQPHPDGAGGHPQRHALGEELPQEPVPPGAQSGAHRNLLLTDLRPTEKKVGHVGASDEQPEEGYRREDLDQHAVRRAGEPFAHRHHREIPSPLAVRVDGGESLGDGVQLPLYLSEVGARTEASESQQVMGAPVLPVPEVRWTERVHVRRDHVELLGHDPDDGVGDAVQREGASEDVTPAEEPSVPELVLQHQNGPAPLHALVRAEPSSERGLNAHQIEDARLRHHHLQLLGHVGAGEVGQLGGVRRGLLEAGGAFQVLSEVGCRHAGRHLHGLAFAELPEDHQLVLILEGKGLTEESVHEGEHGGVGRDAQRQRECRDPGDHRCLEQHAYAEPEILHECRHLFPHLPPWTSLAGERTSVVVHALESPYGDWTGAVSGGMYAGGGDGAVSATWPRPADASHGGFLLDG